MRIAYLSWIGLLAAIPALGADELIQRVGQLAAEITPQVIQWRRDFHCHPELSNREQRTGRVVADVLRTLGVDELRTGVAGHGVVALIRGSKPGPCVALRADMDALPVDEQTGLAFASQTPGVMHACGHDLHTSVLLGAAKVLVQLRSHLQGNVKLIFQPAEEGVPPGEQGGAPQMIAEGVLERPSVSAIFALHVSPELKTGTLAYRPGVMFAAVDRFRVTIIGRQSHAAMPWQGVDPIVAAGQVITALQTIPSRRIDAREAVVVSVGIVRAGTAWNIIPDQAVLEGTIRNLEPKLRQRVAEEFRRIVENTAAAHGAKARIEMHDYSPAVMNDGRLAAWIRPTLARIVGPAAVLEAQATTGGEDFAHYALKVPGLYFRLGTHDPKLPANNGYGLHNPHVVLDEGALPIGVRAMATVAIDYLGSQAKP
jgi:amidohydrolase